MIDRHIHLADVCFDSDRLEVRRKAAEAGVRAVLVVGEVLAATRRVQRALR
jgi:Tat protein secretion system quality control protein TatD with DNase activity